MTRISMKNAALGLGLLLLVQHGIAQGFELVELDLDLDIDIQEETFDYDFSGFAHTGFTIENPKTAHLGIKAALLPQLGRLENEGLQEGFVLFDGTLFLEVNDLDDVSPRIRTTYRMDVYPRMLRDSFLRARFARHLGMDENSAEVRARARAARLADVRIMRFVEEDGRWLRAAGRASDARARFVGRAEADGRAGHYGYYSVDGGGDYVWTVLDRNSRYAVGLNVDVDDDGVFNRDDECPGTAEDAIVDSAGCAIAQYCPCENEWANHGAYVSCTAKSAESFLAAGLIDALEKDLRVSEAAQSSCGAAD